MQTDHRTTRPCDSFVLGCGTSSAPGLLVRIYPLNGLERPVELTASAVVIGRESGCCLHLDDDSVSRRHATIECQDGVHYLVDLGSKNGTFRNEKQVAAREPLSAGDRLRFGNQIFKYLTADEIESQYHDVVFKMMTTDGLTGLHNRRYFLEALDRELAQSHGSDSCLCVMIMDLDKFKAINDTYGHLAGDAVLVEFARRAKSILRKSELLARYGGEEFVLLSPRTDPESTIQTAERIRESMDAAPILIDSVSIPVTISIGVCCWSGHSRRPSGDLLEMADQQLYLAKNSGRNQVRQRICAE